MKYFNIILLFIIPVSIAAQEHDPFYFNRLSEDFLRDALDKKNTQKYREELASIDPEFLNTFLENDTKRIAFWVNIYNAYIQHILQKDTTAYQKKMKFFSSDQIHFFNQMISLDKIEHGFLRRSQWKYSLGNFRRVLVKKYERILRVDDRDYRIHFALNCGARSCPPVVILTPEKLEEQLDRNTSNYVKNTTEYDPEQNRVSISPLFMWFRGDFGNKKGIRKILTQLNLIPEGSKPSIETSDYDWTIDLDNWVNEESSL